MSRATERTHGAPSSSISDADNQSPEHLSILLPESRLEVAANPLPLQQLHQPVPIRQARFSEMTTSSSMYTTRRLRLLGQAGREPGLTAWSQSIQEARKRMAPSPKPTTVRPAPPRPAPPPAPADSIRVVCAKCQTAMRIPFAVLRGKPSLNGRRWRYRNRGWQRWRSDRRSQP